MLTDTTAYLALFAQCVLSGVFAVAGAAKLAGLRGFGLTVRQLVPVGPGPAVIIAGLVAAVELATAGLVWWPARSFGLGLAAVLLAGFAALAFRQAGRPEPVACRCFGRSAAVLGTATGVRNLLLVAVAVAGVLAAGRLPAQVTALPLPGIALTVTVACTGLLVAVFHQDLTDLART